MSLKLAAASVAVLSLVSCAPRQDANLARIEKEIKEFQFNVLSSLQPTTTYTLRDMNDKRIMGSLMSRVPIAPRTVLILKDGFAWEVKEIRVQTNTVSKGDFKTSFVPIYETGGGVELLCAPANPLAHLMENNR